MAGDLRGVPDRNAAVAIMLNRHFHVVCEQNLSIKIVASPIETRQGQV